ncbi:hypothetical protein [Rossellomorea aquimaris]|uniref:hypothetical protein n=1 Tax=Rossellomorea aquimaris TaxID=189382 RepID=UPI0007D099D4|nr:hypothetical protein [Rossellomorea aquimaris]
MNEQFSRPKGFGEILDHTFRLSKNRFKDFFLIYLILVGPVYLLQGLIQLAAGTSFFRAAGNSGNWIEDIINSFNTETVAVSEPINMAAEIGIALIGLIAIILLPVAEAAILFALNHIRKNEEYTVKKVIKQAFSRFWPIIGSSILFGLIVFGLIVVPMIIIGIGGGVFGVFMEPSVGIIFAIIAFLAVAVGIAYLLTRWSFYFGAVVLENDAPGISRSWTLTKKRTWVLMGLYIIFSLIVGIVSIAFELSFGALLGNSVVYGMIINLVSLFTGMVFAVGYGVMFLDLKTRHDGDDLNEMIDDYNAVQ